MNIISAALAELEKPILQNLRLFLSRELEREYLPKHRNKALKIKPEALLACELDGEQLKARLVDAGKTFRVDITFPLFDLASDFTLVQCSCSRDALSLEPLRCPHMYFVEQRFLSEIDELERQAATQKSPLDSWEAIWGEEAPAEDLIDEERWVLILDRTHWKLNLEKQARARYRENRDEDSHWRRVDRRDLEAWRTDLDGQELAQILSRGRGVLEAEIFELLAYQLEASEDSLIAEIVDRETLSPLTLQEGKWQIQIEAVSTQEDAGYWLRPRMGELPLRRLVAGKGAVTWSETEPETIFIVRLEARAERFISQVIEQERPIPAAEKERMLAFLERLDPRLLNLSAGKEEAAEAVSEMQGVLRLTPFVRGGMKVEVLLRIAPQLLVRAGEGAERLRDFGSSGQAKQRIWERDFPSERRLARQLSRGLNLDALPEVETGIFIAYNYEKALELMREVEAYRAESPLLIEWPASLQKTAKPYAVTAELDTAKLSISVGEKKDWFQVEGWLELDEGTKISLREMLAAIRMQKKYIQLPDGRWALISEHFRQRLEPLQQAVEFSPDDTDGACSIDLAALASPETSAALAAFPFVEASKAFWRQVQRAKHRPEKNPSLPAGLQAELRPYQIEGFRWLLHLYENGLGACLADDMGLGKTLQTLALLLKKAGEGPALVIAPSSLSYNWAAEARRFCPELRIVLLRDLEDRAQGRSFGPGEVLIASYGLIMRYAERLSSQQWNIIVLDEAQQIKNAQTKTAQAVRLLNGRWKLGLSGTPIENRLSELWSLFHTLSPGLFGEWERFRRSFVFPIERDRSPEAQERLRRKISPFVLRRLKKDYLSELPEKTEIDLWVDLSAEEQEFYEALRGEAVDRFAALEGDENPETQAKKRMQVLAALTKLRQASCHRRLLDQDWEGGSTKIELLRERLAELSTAGHAALVFSQFTRFLKEIAAALEADGRKILYLDGQTPVAERLELVDRFQQGGYDALLISLKAGGTGLNLTRASYVFHMDPWWNPAVELQATDRAYRMGQKQAVTVYKLRARQTIEEVIHMVHGEKKELVENVLAGRSPDEVWSWEAVWAMLQGREQKLDYGQGQKPGPSREGARI